MPSWLFHWTFLATITVYPSLTFKTVQDVNYRDKKEASLIGWHSEVSLFLPFVSLSINSPC